MNAMKRFLNPKGIIGLVLIVLILSIAIFSPLIFPEGAGTKMNMTARLKGPALAHWFGTDQLGRDLLVRVMLGARTSLTIAGLAVGLSILIGLPLGIISGYYRGHIDNILMRLVDTLLSFPALLLALTISAMLGPNLQNTIIASASPSPRSSPASSGARHCAWCRCRMSRRRAPPAPTTCR